MNENRMPENPAIPSIDVKIYLPKDPEKDHGKLLGFASVNLGGVFAVNNVRIYNSEKGPFVSMPSSKGMETNGQYHDICCPTTKEMREALHGAVLNEYHKAVEHPSVRGSLQDAAKEAAVRPAQVRTADRGVR